jgi:hypothetical protein
MKAKINTNKKGIFLVINKEKIRIEKTKAYIKGFDHGLKKGYDKNPYTIDAYRWLYNVGYDAGVSEYCYINHPEDENV